MLDSLVASPQTDIEERLQAAIKLFGFGSLFPEQDELIRASIAGQDVLGVLPTGRGKSACFQIPGVVTGERTIVISPLIALQEDQIQVLRKLGIAAYALHSGLSEARRNAVRFYFKMQRDEPSFLYLSPELLMTELFHQQFDGAGFTRMAVDEAHCVSTWGDSFRPDYQRIALAAKRLRIRQCSAFTATVDKKIEDDIRRRIPLKSNFLKVEMSPMRPNLNISMEQQDENKGTQNERFKKKFFRLTTLLTEVPEYTGPTIVYCSSRGGAAGLWLRFAKMKGFKAKHGYEPLLFHANLPYEDKGAALETFKAAERPLVFATTAFGMGINRADVRQIIHYHTPRTLIEYAQQIGRGGRDGAPALCTTFRSSEGYLANELMRAQFEMPDIEFVERIHGQLYRLLEKMEPQKRKKYNISSFHRRIELIAEKFGNTYMYVTKATTALALLQQTGFIVENNTGLTVRDFEYGSQRHTNLIGKTFMYEKMMLRERARIKEFFGTNIPTQDLLWEILKRDDEQ